LKLELIHNKYFSRLDYIEVIYIYIQLTLREIINIRRYKQQDTEQLSTMSTAALSLRHMRDKTTKSLLSKIVT